jgi:hypothetical protein
MVPIKTTRSNMSIGSTSRIIAFLFLQTFCFNTLEAQHTRYALNLNIGIEDFKNLSDDSNLSLSEKTIPYLTAGGFAQFFFDEAYYAKVGLQLNWSNRQYELDNNIAFNFGYEYLQNQVNRTNYYAGLAVSLGQKAGKVSFELGLQLIRSLVVDNSQSIRRFKFFNLPEEERPLELDFDPTQFYLEHFFQISMEVGTNLEVLANVIRNPKSEDYKSQYPRYRYSVGLIRFFGKSQKKSLYTRE